jgi:iron(III) transport system substrate-binding protein
VTRQVCGIAVLVLACACEKPDAVQQEANPEPVVVYAAYADEEYLRGLFTGLTRETGVRVTLRHANEDRNVRDVVGNTGSPAADVLLTATVSGIWTAADEGALRPLQSPLIDKSVPAVLRDPDGYWVATAAEVAVMAARPGTAEGVSDFSELADPGLAGKLCLSISTNAINRGVIAQLIANHGTRPAELIVRGWMRNLARPPYASEAQLLAAIAAGSCTLGLVSESAARDGRMEISMPEPAVAAIHAAGVARHARSPEAAKRLIEWLIGADVQLAHAEARGHFAVNPGAMEEVLPEIRHPSIAGVYDLDAARLAERVGWR